MVDTRRLIQIRDSIDIDFPVGNLVVALSGGADSSALAWLVVGFDRVMRAVHVDHGLPHSSTMRRAATEVAEHVGIDLQVVETTVPPGPSPEGQARAARYDALAEGSRDDEAVLTAHTADDNLETVVINLVRGSAARGLGGIPPFRPPNIHRPLLKADRSQLRELALLAGLPFVDDPMNLDPGITRNRVRATVIPRLRELNPGVAATVTRMTEMTREDADYLDSVTPVDDLAVVDDAVRIPIGRIATLPEALANRLLIRALQLCDVGPTGDRVERIQAVVRGDSGREQITGAVGVWRTGPTLIIGSVSSRDAESVDLSPGEHRHRGMVFDVMAIEDVCRVAPMSYWHAVFPVGTNLQLGPDRTVSADGVPAWIPGEKRLPVAWYQPGELGYLSVFVREESGWKSSP